MLPMVMPANLVKTALHLELLHPKRLAVICSPNGWADPKGLPYALDNGRFSVWSKGKPWKEDDLWHLIEQAKAAKNKPLWIACPDVVANAEATIREWYKWHKPLSDLDWSIAIVVQDGMTVSQVKSLRPRPDVVFVGGATRWKWENLRKWCSNFPRVHVGRVNTERMLWKVHDLGAESSDGTGWWHHRQYKGLCRYLERSDRGLHRYNYTPIRARGWIEP